MGLRTLPRLPFATRSLRRRDRTYIIYAPASLKLQRSLPPCRCSFSQRNHKNKINVAQSSQSQPPFFPTFCLFLKMDSLNHTTLLCLVLVIGLLIAWATTDASAKHGESWNPASAYSSIFLPFPVSLESGCGPQANVAVGRILIDNLAVFSLLFDWLVYLAVGSYFSLIEVYGWTRMNVVWPIQRMLAG